MVPTSDKTGKGRIRRKRTKGPFKGVRMRKWGRWVSEIRVPQSRSRIWLGSYDTAEKAARAYDAALYCLRGSQGKFNFPNDKRPELPDGSSTTFSKTEIKAVASRFASPNSLSVPSSTSSLTSTTSSPELEAPILAGETGSTWDAGDSHFAAGVTEPDMFSPETFLLEEPLMLEPDCIWDILDRN
ncbi:AP2/ERF domain [Macleaya cordata]|uniref:AP2/ERF domain n=1 Tax=Macleaya cordata TaxID=56857 RepID=A0A200R9E3_MACCD|nr:AP2/ERF domain [Macleaya cordata]